METINFDLQQSINRHIENIQSKGSITNSDAEELKGHLYDASVSLTSIGLSDEEAFIIATKRLGNEELLSAEYSKVNTTISTDKVWAYLFIGFNSLVSLSTLTYIAATFLYYLAYANLNPFRGSMVITGINILFMVSLWWLLSKRNSISKFVARHVDRNTPWIVGGSFLILFAVVILGQLFGKLASYKVQFFYEYGFKNLAEFTYYGAILNVFLVFVCLVFSINRPGETMLATVFEKPAILFTIIFGIIVELFAASSRVLIWDEILLSSAIFGLVYFLGSLILSYYNKGNVKYLIAFATLGLVSETGVGIMADIERGNTYFTVFFVIALVMGVIGGRLVGMKMLKSKEEVYS